MNEIEELRRQIASLQERNRELEEELYRLTRKQYVTELRPGKPLFWVEVRRQTGGH